MDIKQFQEFQSAIQFVVDEQRRKESTVWVDTPLEHRQETWAMGRTQEGIISATFEGDHPQVDWHPVCPTACCVAGNIVIAHGDTLIAPAWNVDVDRQVTVEECVDEDGYVHRIGYRAKELAGLDTFEADKLFNQNNDAEKIVELATRIAYRHGHTLQVI